MSPVGAGIGPKNILTQPIYGFPGDLSASSITDRLGSASWLGAVLVDIWTVTVGGFTSDHEYVLTVTAAGGVSFEVAYTSDSSSSIDEVVTGLTAAWNADPIASAYGEAVADLTGNTITITGIGGNSAPPLAFTVADSDSDLTTVHTQTASNGSSIAPARFVVKQTNTTASPLALVNPTPQALPVTALTARAVGLTAAYSANGMYGVTIGVAGASYETVVGATTDTAATRTAIVAAINAMMPANTVVAASGSAGAFTLTAEVVGQWFSVLIWAGGGGTLVQDSDTALLTDDIAKIGLGFTLRRSDVAGVNLGDSANPTPYNPGDALALAQFCRQWLDADGTPTSNAAVYVDTTTGKAGASSGSGKCYLPNAKWSGRAVQDASAYEIALNLPQIA